ncbi:MAG: GNAT family N-acetyltransferase [Actinomycetota bacterium]
MSRSLQLFETLHDDDGDHLVAVRLITLRDEAAWAATRLANHEWLAPWEATAPGPTPSATFRGWVRTQRRQYRAGESVPFVIEFDGRFVGQVSVTGVQRGSLLSASVGYWVSREVAGRGITPLAVAMTADFLFQDWGLHRVEINIRPENAASLRVVDKLGFRDEGVRLAYMHIAGAWADHRSFALTAPEAPDGVVRRLRDRTSTWAPEF